MTARALAAAAAVPLLLAATAAPAAAAWAKTTQGANTASAGQLSTPAGPHATVDGDTVTVTWSPPSGGVPATGWRLTRGSTVVCEPTAATTSCTDQPPAGEPVRYTVRGTIEGWTSPASPESNEVTVQPVSPLSAPVTGFVDGVPGDEPEPIAGPSGPEQASEATSTEPSGTAAGG